LNNDPGFGFLEPVNRLANAEWNIINMTIQLPVERHRKVEESKEKSLQKEMKKNTQPKKTTNDKDQKYFA
jgi:hypothetical protein